MNREDQILTMIRDGLPQYADDLKGYSIFLFGSRARGDAKKKSDFDIGIHGTRPVPMKTFFKLSDFFDRLPTLYQIDWVDLNRVGSGFREEALKKTRLIYEQS